MRARKEEGGEREREREREGEREGESLVMCVYFTQHEFLSQPNTIITTAHADSAIYIVCIHVVYIPTLTSHVIYFMAAACTYVCTCSASGF